jgi:ankyrin repeat protein
MTCLRTSRMSAFAIIICLAQSMPAKGNPLPAPPAISDAVWSGKVALVEKLIEGESPSTIASHGLLQMAAGRGNVAVLGVLLDHGADVANKDYQGMTALHRADNPAIAKILLDRGADISARSDLGWTPLRMALKYNKSDDLVRYLLERDANINDYDDKQNDIIYETLFLSCRPKALGILLDAGADPNKKNPWGMTPLSQAIKDNRAECAEVLRQHGAHE